MQILSQRQIQQKVKRIAIEILERNFAEAEIILAGINNNGVEFANLLLQSMLEVTEKPITLTRIRLNPANPLDSEAVIEMPLEQIEGKTVIIIDDVANTGRTFFYAIAPLLKILPKKIEVAALVDRKHKAFPIEVNYVGLSLATTIQENIEVRLRDVEEWVVNLK
jgi:pyrimidine operon attenuation protein / uracil phosphoribosyltransferase